MTASGPPPGRFMVAVAAVLEHQPSGDILMLQRAADNDFAGGVWEDISGRMHAGEDPADALRREIREETGIGDVEIVRLLRAFHFYRGPELPEFEIVGIAHWCRTQSRAVRLSREHMNHEWLAPSAAMERAGTAGIRARIAAFVAARSGVGSAT
jgi:8-oxo-dGTP diphosphatase